jgi:hypothetical protein
MDPAECPSSKPVAHDNEESERVCYFWSATDSSTSAQPFSARCSIYRLDCYWFDGYHIDNDFINLSTFVLRT